MTLKLVTDADNEPLTLAQAKRHLRVDHSHEDEDITDAIVSARKKAEHLTGRTLTTQTWERVLDAFPAVEIELGIPPAISQHRVLSIVSLTYIDQAGVEQTMNPADYSLDADTAPGWVLPSKALGVWPSTLDTANAVRVRFTTGYSIEQDKGRALLRSFMRMEIGTLYKMRESIVAGVSIADLPGGYHERLLDPYRLWGV